MSSWKRNTNTAHIGMQRTFHLGQPMTASMSFDDYGFEPSAMAFDGYNLWVAANNRDLVHIVNPANGAIIQTIQLAKYGHGVADMATDGANMWCIVGQYIVVVSVQSYEVVTTYDMNEGCSCIAAGIHEMYIGSAWRDVFFKVKTADGTVVDTVGVAKWGVGLKDIIFDGSYVWTTLDGKNSITATQSQNSVIQFTEDMGEEVGRLAYSGLYVWAASLIRDVVFKTRLVDGSIKSTVGLAKTGAGVTDIVFDGVEMWGLINTDSDIFGSFVAGADEMTAEYTVAKGVSSKGERLVFDGKFIWVSHPESEMITRL